MRKNIGVVVGLILLTSIGFTQGESSIKVKIKKSKGEMIYLQKAEQNKQILVDSAKVNWWGVAKLKTKVEESGFYQVSKAKKEGIPLVLHGKESVKINAGKELYNNYAITGSKDSELIHAYFGVKNNKDLPKDSLANYAKQFIEKNNTSLALFIALGDIKQADQKKYFGIAEKGIGKSHPNTVYHNVLKQYVKQLNQPRKAKQQPGGLAIGSVAPELNFESPEGDIITLESLRGKYVLIDFWASWCGPCRRENPNVVKAYNKYKDAGFDVYSVSLDKDKKRWIQAIKKDGLIWPSHVSDLKQWRSAAVQKYQFRGIPYTVLLDKEGKIIATRLRGKQLEAKLEELLGF